MFDYSICKKIPTNLSVCCSFLRSLLVSASNSLFIVMFKILQASWVIAVDSFLKKSS